MKTRNMTTLPARAVHRHRLLLAAALCAAVPALCVAAGLFSGKAHFPTLVAVEEMPLDARAVARKIQAPAAVPLSRQSLVPETRPSQANETLASSAGADAVADDADLTNTTIRHDDDDANIRYFNGRPVRPARTMTMVVTAYSPDERSCGKFADNITASGYSVWTNGMKLVAADTTILPFGTLVSIPGYDDGNVVPVLDRGGAIKGNRLDVLYPTHELALRWGVQELEVTVWEYADGLPNDFKARFNSASAVKD